MLDRMKKYTINIFNDKNITPYSKKKIEEQFFASLKLLLCGNDMRHLNS